jgi:uncharacterized membrane protein
MWLDANLLPPDPALAKTDVEGELWMVHSGGFYEVERKKIGPGSMPKILHWFKYEALFTWISGFFLLGIVYYGNAGAFLIDPDVRAISHGTGVLIGIGTLAVSWFVYDGLWQSKLGREKTGIASVISLIFAGSVAFGFCKFLSGRAAYIHTGAMFGTWMVANVWVRILPAQQKMVDATKAGKTPDYSLSGQAKRRSVHNTYMTYPVLFMMLSNHYPQAYHHHLNWLILFLLIIFGASIRHVMVAKEGKGMWAVMPAMAAGLALVLVAGDFSGGTSLSVDTGPRVSFAQVETVMKARCVVCHSADPQIKSFGATPGGVSFETSDKIHALAERIKYRAVTTKSMPLANMTHITDEEREILGRWVDQGSPL